VQYQEVTPHHHALDACDRGALESTLSDLLAANVTITSLDLVGCTNQDKLLTLGTWVIDGSTPKVRALFRELAEQRVLARLGVERVRLFGCHTASTPRARKTLAALAEILELEVTGTTELACACPGPRTPAPANLMLDLDALPVRALTAHEHLASVDETHQILQLVNRTAGAHLPRLLASAHHTLALPSYIPDAYHYLDMLLDFEYVRVAGDLVFPVDDPRALRTLVERT
jgi:hypothetical protein